jgi:hypothetical protein
MTTTRPKATRERIRNIYKSIILDYFMWEQWRATYDDKRWQYWTESRLYDDNLSKGEYPAIMPQTEIQLLKVIIHSGYPEVSRKTVRRCLHEMVEDGVLYRYHPDVGRRKNQKFYALPLQSMPSRDILLMFEIDKQMARIFAPKPQYAHVVDVNKK